MVKTAPKNPYEGSLDEHMVHVFGYATCNDWDADLVIEDAKNAGPSDGAWPTVATMGTGKAGIREAFGLVLEEIESSLIGEIGYAGAKLSKEDKEYLARLGRARWKAGAWDSGKKHRTWWLQEPRRKKAEPYACIVERILELHK